MEDPRQDLKREIALFRYGVIADLIHLKPGYGNGLYERLAEKAALDYKIPGSRRCRLAPETIRHWLKLYRRGQFDALLPKSREDIGESRSLDKSTQDLLLTLKDEHPSYSIPMLIEAARNSGKLEDAVPLPPSTVHRLLLRNGLSKRQQSHSAATGKDHRRFEFEKAGQLWMSDVMHGPSVVAEGQRKRKTYLIAFIDDATRVVPYAAFALGENNAAFLPVLKQAIIRRGLPQRLFVDNGAAYRSQHLALVMAKLGITLIHARPHHPQAKGKIERYFRTVRSRFLPTLEPGDYASLEAINRRLWGWIEGEYHRSPHRGLDGVAPMDRWSQVADEVKYVGPSTDLDDLFLFEQKRKVRKDRTVSLDGCVYEVEASLVDETVTLRFNPARRQTVEVCHNGKRVQIAKPVDLRANCSVKRDKPGAISLSQMAAEDDEMF